MIVSQDFYPRSPCGERQINIVNKIKGNRISIHALLAESDLWATCGPAGGRTFLSTLSLRRATKEKPRQTRTDTNFYPRSPCGERPLLSSFIIVYAKISIHALLAESDRLKMPCVKLSIISIHALLAESDEPTAGRNNKNNIFLSTLSLRRATPNG